MFKWLIDFIDNVFIKIAIFIGFLLLLVLGVWLYQTHLTWFFISGAIFLLVLIGSFIDEDKLNAKNQADWEKIKARFKRKPKTPPNKLVN
ncbi:hypothetical protein [Lonepinella koalarum]|uniref:Uncharacterized protein n=1 Tax=Lonepinella koalarum TaxID=53417 RepID=A0A4R1KJK9_9PAST|nr:hypothetical protein [Lonepinella koalarum]MDH2927357.1 hypothetical protein [Lonepinella koalarum]TCK64912.1 hypothetical protein EV692_2396 [Lonepinella koalarum]TFJ88830.1 hypothetical protein E0709_11915 [Lonepinella koalarum]